VRRLVVGGLAALGIVGGTATVAYNHFGTATVKVRKNGVTRTVKVGAQHGGPTYSCPEDVVEHEITPMVKLAGRIKLTLHEVESKLKALRTRYPSGRAPGAVVSHYNRLLRRGRGLESAFNKSVTKHNALLARDCKMTH